MAKLKSSVAAAAREKARSAKAALDAQRAEHDRLLEEATTEYYVAVEEAENARSEVVAAEDRQVQALRRLVNAGENNETIAALTGATLTAVRSARKKSTVEDSDVNNKSLDKPEDPSNPAGG